MLEYILNISCSNFTFSTVHLTNCHERATKLLCKCQKESWCGIQSIAGIDRLFLLSRLSGIMKQEIGTLDAGSWPLVLVYLVVNFLPLIEVERRIQKMAIAKMMVEVKMSVVKVVP